jgi:hypothetical protein
VSQLNASFDWSKSDDGAISVREKLARFARKPLPAKWAAVKGTLQDAIGKAFGTRPNQQILRELREIKKFVEHSAILAKEEFVAGLLSSDRYISPKRLERYGFKVYSQQEEDGIIQEIFQRIGTTDRRFVEFGVENGLENNTIKLLLEGWRGLWIDGNDKYITEIKNRFEDVLENGRLTAIQAFITVENINELIGSWGNGEIDLVSIDIDGNDFHIWQALAAVTPRVVVIEYNAKFRPPLSIVQNYSAEFVWSGTDYFGASLEALTRLGRRLGYSLVGTNLCGSNAFFVRTDLVGDKFHSPFSAETHYNPPRYFLYQLYVSGHPPDWGRYIQVE